MLLALKNGIRLIETPDLKSITSTCDETFTTIQSLLPYDFISLPVSPSPRLFWYKKKSVFNVLFSKFSNPKVLLFILKRPSDSTYNLPVSPEVVGKFTGVGMSFISSQAA